MKLWQYQAEVLRVVDGDTMDVLVDLGFGVRKKERLRFAGIDAWETRGKERKEGLIAKEFVKNLCPDGSWVMIKTEQEKGKYGRYIATIFVGEEGDRKDLCEMLVQEGHAERKTY